MTELNRAEMERQKPGTSPEERRQFWARVSEFQPSFVSVRKDVKRSMTGLIAIALWAVTMGVASLCVAPKINRIR